MSNTGHLYISRTDKDFVFTVPKSLDMGQRVYTSTTIEGAVAKRNEVLGYDPDQEQRPEVSVETPDRTYDPEELWAKAFDHQEKVEKNPVNKWYDVVINTDKPVAIALLSDMHFGSPYTDYKAIYRDTEIICKTEGMYAEIHGDERDNFILSKLAHARLSANMSLDAEVQLYRSWLSKIQDKVLVYVTGNHDLWTAKTSGLDLAKLLLPNWVLYDPFEVRWRLVLGDAAWRIKTRHRWPGRSILNWTNGIERSWATEPFDIGIGGDYHDGTICREFIRDNQVRFAILTGAYKRLGDPFSKQIGKPQAYHVGSGAIIFFPDGRMQWMRDLQTAADYINYLRVK